LLDFGADGGEDDDLSAEEGDEDAEADRDEEMVSSKDKGKAPEEPEELGQGQTLLTKDMLKEWQRSIIEVRFVAVSVELTDSQRSYRLGLSTGYEGSLLLSNPRLVWMTPIPTSRPHIRYRAQQVGISVRFSSIPI
jgi:hypothetical protein